MEDTEDREGPVDGAATSETPGDAPATAIEDSSEAGPADDARVAPGSAEASGQGLGPIPRLRDRLRDAHAELRVSEDGMLAEASFFPALPEGAPLDVDYFRDLLANSGVVAGILWDDISEAIMSCNLDRRPVRAVAVARGSLPAPEVPEHAALEPKFKRSGPLVAEDAQRVDFRELSSVFVVRANETIARLVPRKAGAVGTDVRGAEAPYPRESPETYSPGRNVAAREGLLVAAVDGRLTISDGRLDVDEVLMLKGGVDFHTGHVAFPGDVIVEGPVHDGFRVHSGKSIVCKSTLDAFDIEAKKDLICPMGIIGRRRAVVRVGGELSAKYVQNCRVAVRGNAKIAAAVVNSRLFCLGTIDLGDKGVAMGGELQALHGLRCGRLGNQAKQRTIVRVGTDFTVQQHLAQANERMRLVAARSRQIDAAAASRPGREADRAKAEIAAAAEALRRTIAELLAKLDADESATVEVHGELFPGVTVEICRANLVVEEPIKACKLRLDKAAGRIVVDRLGGRSEAER